MRADSDSVCITGVGIDIPGVPSLEDFVALWSRRMPQPATTTQDSSLDRLLRYKDRATRMALLAAQEALESAGLPILSSNQVTPELFGVVVSSNLGNIDTVCRVAKTIHLSAASKTRPMDLPNASSNVIASTLAIRFGCKGVNFTLCDGAHSGIDALNLARNLVRSGRATRILVVGVEPLNSTVYKLMTDSSTTQSGAGVALHLGEGAGAIVVETEAVATERKAEIRGHIAGYGYHSSMEVSRSVEAAAGTGAMDVDLWLTPGLSYRETAASIERALAGWGDCGPRNILDLTSLMGEMYGALGVLQGIAACLWLHANRARTAVGTSGACWGDGSASLMITAASNGREGPERQ